MGMKYLLSVVVLTAAALMVPNFLTARNRSAQKRTMADIRSAATAWEARATDRNSYLVGVSGRVTYENLRRAVEPTYVKHLARTDGWGNPFEFTGSAQEYSIRSLGSDRRADARFVPGATTDFASDIVYSNGTFLTYPEGI